VTKRDQRERVTGAQMAHLHVHTEYSSLDGMGRIDDYVSRASQLGQAALAITDHGTLSGLPEFYAATKKAGVEPILGCEFYIVEDHAWREKGKQPERSHLTVLGRGAEGYRVLTELSTLSHHQYYYKPVLDRANLEDLGDAAQHLTVLSGCAGSMLSAAVLSGDRDRQRSEMLWWRETFPNFYVELMHHDTSFDRKLNRGLVRLARKYDVPWVVTNDPHFVNEDEHDVHDALLAIQVAKPIDDPDRFRFDGRGYHLRSRKEMRGVIEGNYGADVWSPGVANTLRIAKDCYTSIPSWNKRTWQVPKFPDTDDAYKMVKDVSFARLKELGKHNDPVYRAERKKELAAYKAGEICDFLLITRETIEWAKSVGIPVGPGRGSVCGSTVSYLLGIHKMDPIKYGLLTERFYNPARPRMPDIDTDFGQRRRGEVFKHAEEKYGVENVVAVATFQRMKAKKAFGGLAKAFGYTYQDRLRLSKEIVSDDEADSKDITYILPDEVLRRTPEILPLMEKLVGLKTGVSRHPAGVIIADPAQHIRLQVPELYIASSKTYAGQFDLDQVEHLGLMKQDFLGLRTLDTIDLCVQWVEDRTGVLESRRRATRRRGVRDASGGSYGGGFSDGRKYQHERVQRCSA
jgi:DNA polymerase-3 subunit alpha